MGSVIAVTGVAALCVLCAAPAVADVDDWVTAHGPSACQWMDAHPDLTGSLVTMRTMQDDGLAMQEIPGALVKVIVTYCPYHADLLVKTRQYVSRRNDVGGGIAVVGG